MVIIDSVVNRDVMWWREESLSGGEECFPFTFAILLPYRPTFSLDLRLTL